MLVYTHDTEPGIRRKGAGKGFYYLKPDGGKLTDEATLQRIRSLAIPPAYSDVWICPIAHGHLQATGRDDRGRKQYRYHPEWQSQRNLDKFDRLLEVGRGLPALRRRLRRDLHDFQGERQQVIAAAVRMIDRLGYRVGNERYLEENQTRGVSTLANDNVEIEDGRRLTLHFNGKGGRPVEGTLSDEMLATAVEACHELPGQRLFAYRGKQDELIAVSSSHVNGYLRDSYDAEITAKDLRTWRASTATVDALRQVRRPDDREAEIRDAVRSAADSIANRYATCRKHYVHPRIIERYEASGRSGFSRLKIPGQAELQQAERLLLRLLQS